MVEGDEVKVKTLDTYKLYSKREMERNGVKTHPKAWLLNFNKAGAFCFC